ncbi:zinc finger protein weckle-like [Uranotaenia lowii]|uniref:zinc finger protein weckle-like n=1 Tax=Uranotaenia lowii TaxID=190385 RepID=UPI0024784937|nr:zinc finger protein weckle-like [Uranotaenia lowii]
MFKTFKLCDIGDIAFEFIKEFYAVMSCVVPGCVVNTSPVYQLVQFPDDVVLANRWTEIIAFATGRLLGIMCGNNASEPPLICSWHFGDEHSEGYQEPCRFYNENMEITEVVSCRLCLQLQKRSETVDKDCEQFDQLLAKICKLALENDEQDFLSAICFPCLTKLDIITKWIDEVQQTEAQFLALKQKMFTANLLIFNDEEVKIDIIELKLETIEDLNDSESKGIFSSNKEMETENSDHRKHSYEPLKRRSGRPRNSRKITNEPKAVSRPEKINNLEDISSADIEPSPLAVDTNLIKPRGRKKSLKPPKIDFKDYLSKKCFVCSEKLQSKSDLVCHLTDNHATKVDYTCLECSKSFKTVLSFNHHLSFHDAEHRPKKCRFCSLRFIVDHSRMLHENRLHGEKHAIKEYRRPLRAHQCETCGKVFRTVTQIRDHDNFYHKKIFTSVCNICGKAFPTITLLNKHQLVHTGERSFACEQCGERYKKCTDLTAHMLRHREGYEDLKRNRRNEAMKKAVRGNK